MIKSNIHHLKGGGKNHFDEIDILKGIAILTVVLEHSFAVKYVDLSTITWCATTVAVIKSFNMQLFFMISGFLFANSNTADKGNALIGKVDRLLVPMLFLSLIYIALSLLVPSAINGNQNVGVLETVLNIFVYGRSYWFVYTLFMVFVPFILLKKHLINNTIILTIIALVVLKETNIVQIEILRLKDVLYFSVFFLLGYMAYDKYNVLRTVFKKPYVILSCLFIYMFLFLCTRDFQFVRNWCLPVILSITIIGLSLFLADSSYKFPGLRFFGKYSLQFYLFNGYGLVVSRIFWAKILNVHHPFVLFVLVYISSLLIIFVLVEITRRIPVVCYLCGYGRKKVAVLSHIKSENNQHTI